MARMTRKAALAVVDEIERARELGRAGPKIKVTLEIECELSDPSDVAFFRDVTQRAVERAPEFFTADDGISAKMGFEVINEKEWPRLAQAIATVVERDVRKIVTNGRERLGDAARWCIQEEGMSAARFLAEAFDAYDEFADYQTLDIDAIAAESWGLMKKQHPGSSGPFGQMAGMVSDSNDGPKH